jgi:acyl-CoA synthetase (AMP-forming)/AMP-acid ligase II
MNIAEQLLSAGASGAPALLQGSKTTTYSELRSLVWNVSSWVQGQGGDKGDRIALCAENGFPSVAAYLGVIHAGRVVVPLSPESSDESLASVISNAGCKVLLASRRQVARCKRSHLDWNCRVVAVEEVPVFGAKPDGAQVDASRELAALMFTSGSTGMPKGVMVTHQNIECNTRDIAQYMGLTSEDRAMLVLPLHYCFGLSVLHSHLSAGASLVINNQFLYPETVLQDMQNKSCTGLAGVPSTYQILLRKSRFRQMEFPVLRWLQQAGGRLPNPYITEIRQAFPAVRFFTMYGQTEATARLSYLAPEHLQTKLGSIGKGLASTRLEVLKSDGSPVEPGSDETGEIVASGHNVCRGYWKDPDETARYFRSEKLHTGDLARVDADGFLFIVDRERDMIKSGGNRVSAKEIEDVICELPDVVEVAVIGVPHEWMGEAIAAFVVLTRDPQVGPEEIRGHCRRRLASFKIPGTLEIVSELPHNSSGKVLKNGLRKRLALQASQDEMR